MSLEAETIKIDTPKGVFAHIEKMGHEQIVFCQDAETRLKAVIAIHNTTLGPSLGGLRMWNYTSESEALLDVLRLSRGMTLKASISGLNLGGGKAIIIGDAKSLKNHALMEKFGDFVESLNGKYITAPDVNMDSEDMVAIRKATQYVTGLPESMGGRNPAPATAYGTYLGMKAAAKKKYGNDALNGKKITVQGVGSVGKLLVERLVKEGARVTVMDIVPERVSEMVKRFKVDTATESEVYDLDMDIYAPCALGASLNDAAIARLKCAIVAGSANNQLANEERHSRMLLERDILYAPDFLVNAGGLMSVYCEYLGDYDKHKVEKRVETIYAICLDVFATAEEQQITSQEAAMHLAEKRIDKAKNDATKKT